MKLLSTRYKRGGDIEVNCECTYCEHQRSFNAFPTDNIAEMGLFLTCNNCGKNEGIEKSRKHYSNDFFERGKFNIYSGFQPRK